MRFLLIGHTVKDVISFNGETTVKPGGLFYSASGLVNIAGNRDEIFLLTSYDEKNSKMLEPLYSKCNLKFSQTVPQMPTIHLTLFENKERLEQYENITDKLKIENLLDSDIKFDGILINMITGFEITAEDVLRLRKKFSCKIYFDVHSLSRGMDKDKKRYSRKIPDVKNWLSNIDIVQANENEILTLSKQQNEIEIAREVFSYGPKILLKTMGKKGVRAYYLDGEEITSLFLPAIKINSINQVGCGDVFGASFFYSYISGKDLAYSLRFANTGGGIVTNYETFQDYEELKTDIEKRFVER